MPLGTPGSLQPHSPQSRRSRTPSLLTFRLAASPSTEGFLCPALLQLKDLHFKGVLEWICTDIYLQVLFFFSAFATLNVCGEEITDRNHSRESLRELVCAHANPARAAVRGHTGDPQRQPALLSLPAVLLSSGRCQLPRFASREQRERRCGQLRATPGPAGARAPRGMPLAFCAGSSQNAAQ